MIRTYADINMIYNIDSSHPELMIPRLNCDFPCRTCLLDDPKKCTDCWLKDSDEIKDQYFNQIYE